MNRPLVVALNPSIDAEWRVDAVVWEEKNTIHSERRWAGGKGVNVARWLQFLGVPPRLLLPLGGDSGRELSRDLRRRQLDARVVALNESTRVNVIVTTRRQGQLRFNPPGPRISAAEWSALRSAVKQLLPRASLLILSGSLPGGVPAAGYATLVRLARRAGVRTLLDCDGEALVRAVASRPFLVKPNEHELAGWRGRRLRGEGDLLGAARELSVATGGWVLLSRGPRRSFLVHAADGVCLAAPPPRLRPVNTVGAGDALLAAVAAEILRAAPPAQWLRAGLAAGSAAARLPAGVLPDQPPAEIFSPFSVNWSSGMGVPPVRMGANGRDARATAAAPTVAAVPVQKLRTRATGRRILSSRRDARRRRV